jgi:hypothetical protein
VNTECEREEVRFMVVLATVRFVRPMAQGAGPQAQQPRPTNRSGRRTQKGELLRHVSRWGRVLAQAVHHTRSATVLHRDLPASKRVMAQPARICLGDRDGSHTQSLSPSPSPWSHAFGSRALLPVAAFKRS